MEQKIKHDDRLSIARRLYAALCSQYPDRVITLCDEQGRKLARYEGATASTAAKSPSPR
jgi:hypothetical protein